MTFAARVLTSLAGFIAYITTGYYTVNQAASSGARTATVTLGSDGTLSATGNSIISWCTPSTGIGAYVWAKLTSFVVTTAGTNTVSGTITTSGWLQLTSGGTFSVTSSGISNPQGTYTISLSSDSGGVSIIGSVSGMWTVGDTN